MIFLLKRVFEQMTNIIKTEMPEVSNDKIKVLESLGQVVNGEQAKINSSDYYIDAQVILDYLLAVTKTDEDPNVIPESVLTKATIQFEYIDGIPAVNGLPFWERIDCEDLDFYRLFKIYREQKYTAINKVADDGTPIRRYQRSFENLKETTGLSRKALYAISKVYHWQNRASMYDSFRIDFIAKEKDRMITLMETKHQTAAETIFEKCVKYFTDMDQKKFDKVSPKDILSLFSEGYKLQRLSLGLPGDKPKPDKEKTTSAQVINIKSESKTLNLNTAKGINDGDYMQQMVDILSDANALPVSVQAKSDVIEAVSEPIKKEVEGEKDGENNKKE